MKFIIGIMFFSQIAFAQNDKLLELDPYSIESVEKNFPDAIETYIDVESASDRNYIKSQFPRTITKKRINYEKLVPQMLVVMKEHHQILKALEKK